MMPELDKKSEAPKTEVQKAEEKQAESVEKVNEKSAKLLGQAAESGDAEVQNLLGQRVIAEQNQDLVALQNIDKELGGLLKK